MARKSRDNHHFKVNGQVVRPKKSIQGRNGRLTGAAETQRVSVIVDSYDADLRAGQIPPDQGWHQFAGEKGLLGDVLRAKGLI